jgi:hypothetical protein
MAVVLRLPAGRARAGTRAVTIEPADPAVGPYTERSPEAGTAGSGTDAMDWTAAGTASSAATPDYAAPDYAAPDYASAGDDSDAADDTDRTDWAWVQEWRAGNEPTPWATGLVLTVFTALVVGVAVWVLAAGLSDRPVVAVLVNLLVAGGLTPAIWLSRGLPVLRWIGGGAAAGIVIGWVAAVLMLPLPKP